MTLIKKLLNLLAISIIAMIIASVYGIIHDRITYTISPEYYTKFKFIQFGLYSDNANSADPELLVNLTGVIATWWLGLFSGLVFGIAAFRYKTTRLMFEKALKAIGIEFLTALLFGISGYIYGKMIYGPQTIEEKGCQVPEGVTDTLSFVRVGIIHNFGYAGATIGLFAGIVYLIRDYRRLKSVTYK